MFTSLEPIFDGSFTRLPTSKELVCPGTLFVYFLTPNLNGDASQLGRIIRSRGNGDSATAPINLFQPSVSEDNIPLLNLSCLTETVQVIETTIIVHVHPANILEVLFVIPYVQFLEDYNLLEVSEMKLVRVLCGMICNGRFEECFTPSFPSSYE
jgi:hypothetical protein